MYLTVLYFRFLYFKRTKKAIFYTSLLNLLIFIRKFRPKLIFKVLLQETQEASDAGQAVPRTAKGDFTAVKFPYYFLTIENNFPWNFPRIF
jgi:hypothetical protein